MSKPTSTTTDIGFFLPTFSGGGAERTLVYLANQIVQRGYSVDFVVGLGEGPWLQDVSSNVRVVNLGRTRMIKSVLPLADYLRQASPVAMISALTHANLCLLAAAKVARFPGRLVISERNSLVHVLGQAGLKSKVKQVAMKSLYPRADSIVCVSEEISLEMKNLLRHRAPRLAVIYNPVDQDRIQALAKLAPEIDLAAEPSRIMVAIGRLEAQKDFRTLLDAFVKSRSSECCHLYILGDGPDREILESRVEELGLLGNVHLPGFVSNVYAVLARAHVFVLSSRHEGMPNALLEALACGCRVVSTDCPTGPREILAGYDVGSLVPVGDATAMAAAIDMAMGIEHVVESDEVLLRFRPDRVIEDYLAELVGELSL